MRLSSGKNGIPEIPSLLNRRYGKLVKFFTVFCFENRKKAGKITSAQAVIRQKEATGAAGGFTACQKTFFDTLSDCKNVRTTSNLHPSAYVGTVGGKLRSKSKSLRSKRFFSLKYLKYDCDSQTFRFHKTFLICWLILTVPDFFDSLRSHRRCRWLPFQMAY